MTDDERFEAIRKALRNSQYYAVSKYGYYFLYRQIPDDQRGTMICKCTSIASFESKVKHATGLTYAKKKPA